MTISPQLYDTLNRAWKSTCRILLGDEVGELNEYEPWLKGFIPRIEKRKSYVSGKEIAIASEAYCKNARFVSLDEAKEKTIDPLTINEIKDIDGIIEAVSEKWEYVGNKVLGNSKFVESSDTIADSQYLYDVTNVSNYQYAAVAYNASNSKYIFGSSFAGNNEFLIGAIGAENVKRSFCSSDLSESGDVWLSHNCRSCQDIMFSFHQLNKRNCIGNLELPKERYLVLKKKLLDEIREDLKKNERFPHIFDFVPNTNLDKNITVSTKSRPQAADMKLMEKAFSSTFKILLKKEPGSITEYENWLLKNTIPLSEFPTPFGSKFYISTHPNFPIWNGLPKNRLVSQEESLELADLRMDEKDVDSLASIKEWITKFGCYCEAYDVGKNTNISKSTVLADVNNVYNSYVVVKSDNVGCTSWGIYSKNVFGCHVAKESQFCMKTYNSAGDVRCFEIDTCTRCTDTYFSHNCEGTAEAMFCFNVKGKRYAIGNAQLPPEQYRKIKDAIIEQVADEILKNKELKLSIYNIGCGGKS
jgi:hypothetical protein